MKRVVITGMGIVSSIGNNKQEVLSSLHAGKSGITFSESFANMGLRSHVWGDIDRAELNSQDRQARITHLTLRNGLINPLTKHYEESLGFDNFAVLALRHCFVRAGRLAAIDLKFKRRRIRHRDHPGHCL